MQYSLRELIKLASLNYEAPDNLNTLIYDFYFLEWISSYDLSPQRENLNLNSFAEYCLEKATNKIKDVLIDKLYYLSAQSVVIHTSYILNLSALATTNQNLDGSNDPNDKKEYRRQIEGMSFLKTLSKEIGLTEDETLIWFENLVTEYMGEHISINEIENFLSTLLPLLEQYPEGSTLGGTHLWVEVYKSVRNLILCKDLHACIPLIDHIIDLVHNGGSILEYVFPNREDAKQFFTDVKGVKDIVSELIDYDTFINKISPSLKLFAKKVIYNLTGKTEQMRSTSNKN